MKNILKLLFGILIPVISLLFTLIYFISTYSESKDTLDLFKVILYGVVIPVASTTISLLILRFDFENVKNKLDQSINDNSKKFSDEIIKPLKIEIINAIKPTANYNIIMNHPHRDLLLKFVPDILDTFQTKLQKLSAGHIYEDDPSRYHEFAMSIFNLAEKQIIATSIVDPNGFWAEPDTLIYLYNNRNLINKHKEKGDNNFFIRYFFVNDENKEASLIPILKNKAIGAEVFIIVENDIVDKKYIVDVGLIDDLISIKSLVEMKESKNRRILKVDAYIGVKDKIRQTQTCLKFLETKRKTIVDVYPIISDDAKKAAAI